MSGAGMHFNWSHGDNRVYRPVKVGDNQNHDQRKPKSDDVVNGGKFRDMAVVSGCREPENPTEDIRKLLAPTVKLPLSNVERFLEAITPSVHAHYLSKTTMKGLGAGGVESQPCFVLRDLWESFKEWSAYGVGVPLVLNGSVSVVQYYVPFLSGIQLFIDPSKSPVKSRRSSEDSDGDYFSRDPSSDGSSDSERDRGSTDSTEYQNHGHLNDIAVKMERLLSRDKQMQDDFSSEEGESVTSQSALLFQYLEHDSPYGREPLADKISDLALQLPELKSLRSCDLLSSSWLSVAWYPIYRIPTGPTLKDLDACFLTYHSLHTPIGDASAAQPPVLIYPSENDGSPRISLPAFGVASYKFREALWTSSNGSDRQLLSSLLQAAGGWLRLRQVSHPDYLFFCRKQRY